MPGLVFGSLRPPSLRMLTEIGSESTIWVRFTYSPEKVNLTPILRPDRLPLPAACSKKKAPQSGASSCMRPIIHDHPANQHDRSYVAATPAADPRRPDAIGRYRAADFRRSGARRTTASERLLLAHPDAPAEGQSMTAIASTSIK